MVEQGFVKRTLGVAFVPFLQYQGINQIQHLYHLTLNLPTLGSMPRKSTLELQEVSMSRHRVLTNTTVLVLAIYHTILFDI